MTQVQMNPVGPSANEIAFRQTLTEAQNARLDEILENRLARLQRSYDRKAGRDATYDGWKGEHLETETKKGSNHE